MKYQIADYIIDTARYRISSGDAAIPAEPKVFDLLPRRPPNFLHLRPLETPPPLM